ncbi:MAG: cell division protein FtsH, partial [Ktedonobacteraceae bacterium]|nr:cell division protein FtsH [Ktedonobacteraceae bacterium]
MSTNGKWLRASLFWLLILLVIVLIAVFIFRPQSDVKSVNVSTILHSIQLDQGKQQDTLSVSSDTLTLTRGKGPDAEKEAASIPSNFDAIQALKDSNIDYTSGNWVVLQYQQPNPFLGVLGVVGGLIPFILFGAFLILIVRQAQGSNNQAMSFGKSR